MKLFLVTLLFVVFSTKVISQNTLRIESKEVNADKSFELGVSLDNADEVSAIQFDISYDINEFEILTDHSLTSRKVDHSVLFGNPSEGVLRVVIFSLTNSILNENSGTLVNLEFKSKTNPGTFNFELSNVRVSSSTGEEISATTNDGQITVLGPIIEVLSDDINFGNVLLGSYVTSSLVIRNTGNEPLELTSATDVSPFTIQETFPVTIAANETAYLTVLLDTSSKLEVSKELSFVNNDIDLVRNSQKVILSATVFATNTIRIGNISAEKDVEVEIPVSFDNMEEFTAFQFDLLIPEGLEFVSNSIVQQNNRFDGHSLGANLNGNTLTFIGFSAANKNFIGTSGELFSFKLKPTVNAGNFALNISNAIITNIAQENILSNAYSGFFQINTPNLSISTVDINFEDIPLTIPKQESLTLSNTGSAALVVDEVIFDASKITLDILLPLTIATNSSQNINLIYTPSEVGEFSETISFKSNGLNEESVITVRGSVFSPNYVLVESKDVFVGETSILQIQLKNNDAVRALQFDVELPTGFELKIDDLEITSRTDGYMVAASNIEGSTYKVILYSTTNQILEKGDLSILNFPVFISNNTPLGNYEFNFSNVIITNINNTDISSLSLEYGEISLFLNDTDGDGITDDVDTCSDTPTGETVNTTGCSTSQIDTDGDGIMDDVDTCPDTPTGETVNSTGCTASQLSIEDEVFAKSISLFPNPVLNILSIESETSPILKVKFYSILGGKVKEIKSNFNSIITNDLSRGIYILQIYSDKGMTVRKIIKK